MTLTDFDLPITPVHAYNGTLTIRSTETGRPITIYDSSGKAMSNPMQIGRDGSILPFQWYPQKCYLEYWSGNEHVSTIVNDGTRLLEDEVGDIVTSSIKVMNNNGITEFKSTGNDDIDIRSNNIRMYQGTNLIKSFDTVFANKPQNPSTTPIQTILNLPAPDWEETDQNSLNYIANKPALGSGDFINNTFYGVQGLSTSIWGSVNITTTNPLKRGDWVYDGTTQIIGIVSSANVDGSYSITTVYIPPENGGGLIVGKSVKRIWLNQSGTSTDSDLYVLTASNINGYNCWWVDWSFVENTEVLICDTNGQALNPNYLGIRNIPVSNVYQFMYFFPSSRFSGNLQVVLSGVSQAAVTGQFDQNNDLRLLFQGNNMVRYRQQGLQGSGLWN